MDPKVIDDLARRLYESVPDSVRGFQADIEQNFKSVLQATLDRLDLVTREEFEVQTGVLERTREKLKVLERRLEDLEAKEHRDA